MSKINNKLNPINPSNVLTGNNQQRQPKKNDLAPKNNGRNKLELALAALAVASSIIATGVAVYKHKKVPIQTIFNESSTKTSKLLSDINFNKSIAYLKNGAKFTGIIEDTLKNGDKIILEYADGIIKNSSRNGSVAFEKVFETLENGTHKVTTIKNGISNSVIIENLQNIAQKTQAKLSNLSKLISQEAISRLPQDMNPVEIEVRRKGNCTFDNLLSKKQNGNYQNLFIGQIESSPNVVVNQYLRRGEISPDWTEKEIIEIIESAHDEMTKIHLPHDTILYRCVNDFNFIPEVGETYIEKGFVSTSANQSLSRGYGKKLIKIIAPKGTPCIPNTSYLEILLKDNSHFKVLSKSGEEAELLLILS